MKRRKILWLLAPLVFVAICVLVVFNIPNSDRNLEAAIERVVRVYDLEYAGEGGVPIVTHYENPNWDSADTDDILDDLEEALPGCEVVRQEGSIFIVTNGQYKRYQALFFNSNQLIRSSGNRNAYPYRAEGGLLDVVEYEFQERGILIKLQNLLHELLP